MVTSKYRHLPTAEDLPDSDETPVDKELQNDIPNLLLSILKWLWRERTDWFWGVDMGIYYDLNKQNPEQRLKIKLPKILLAALAMEQHRVNIMKERLAKLDFIQPIGKISAEKLLDCVDGVFW